MGRNSKSRKVITRSESGTCNVCSAPCSSCLHINRALTSVKREESSGETCQENAGSQFSVTDEPLKTSARDAEQHTGSETSNTVSANSNSNLCCRDAESKDSLRSYCVSGASDLSPGRTAEDLCDKRALKSKFEERRGLESREDSSSCVTGGNVAIKLASFKDRIVGLRHALDEFSSHKKELIKSCSEEKSEGVRSLKPMSTSSNPSSGRSMSCNPDVKDQKENLGSDGHLNSSLTKDIASNLGPGQETMDHNMHESHFMASDEVCLKLEAETETKLGNSVAAEKVGLKLDPMTQNNTTDNQPNDGVNFSDKIKKAEKVESSELPDMQENNVQSKPISDTDDDSDVLEHDVKVCDICGDAGREDLLAICSRCSDGAEHTYCMRDKLDKVPEGDWLCEECKFSDENRRIDTIASVDVSDNHQSTEVASVEDTNLLLKLDRNVVAGTKSKKDILGKRDTESRSAECIETSTVAKKQALGQTVESSKATSPSRAASLSRDPSFRKFDRGEMKPPQVSSAVCSTNDISEDAFSLRGQRQAARGILSKSSSFSTNGKPKEFFDEVPQKQKVARETAYTDKKEGVSKLIGRSMSFRPLNSGRLNSSESKVKMLSPKFPHPQDNKGLRQSKAQNILERKSSFKPEHGSGVSVSNADQKHAPSDPYVCNNSEVKGLAADSKLSKQSKCKGEMKIKETCLRDDSSAGTYIAEKPRGGLPGVLPRPLETKVPGERIRESCVSRSRTSVDSPRDMASDVSAAARSSADVIKGNKLKAAIEAAILKKPGICRKNKPNDQSDDLSTSNTNLNGETHPEDHSSILSKRRNTFSLYEDNEGQASFNNGDQIPPLSSVATTLRTGHSNLVVPSGLSSQSSAAVSILLNMPVLPEHESIWQGGFDVRRSGRLAELREGMQAHLSTCASPKVLEVVKKLPSKVMLNEVPRLSTWPIQFQEAGVKEDNIALYFFAKDYESYERSYKNLLDMMMKRDLALKGNFDGVELLIFTSNHLPQNAQRWNMLYFLWGVFRGNKVNRLQDVSGSDACNASLALECPTTMNLTGTSKNVNAISKISASLASGCHSSENSNGLCDIKAFSSNPSYQCLKGNDEKQDFGLDAKRTSGLLAQVTTGSAVHLEANAEPKSKIDAKFHTSVQDAETNSIDIQQRSSSSGTSPRLSPTDVLTNLERTVKKEDGCTDMDSSREKNMMDEKTREEPNEGQFTLGKRLRCDLIPEAPDTSISSIRRSADKSFLPDGEFGIKKQKTDSAVVGPADDKMFAVALEGEMKAVKRGIPLDLNEAQDYSDSPVPSPAAKQGKDDLFDLNVAQDYPPDKEEEGDGSALLSLSLSFPFSDKEPEKKLKTEIDSGLPERPKSSLLLFDGLSKK